MAKVLIFRSRSKLFGMPVGSVEEVLWLDAVSEVPSDSRSLRGGITVRGTVLPLHDFRALIGEPRLRAERDELVATLGQREAEHIAWLDSLETSVKEGVPFRKALDPTQCAFGQWFYAYHPADEAQRRSLARFEAPHREIHALAEKVLTKARGGDVEQAMSDIDSARNTTLALLLRLFKEFKKSLVDDMRELALVLKTGAGHRYAVVVDGVDNIRSLNTEDLNPSKDGFESAPIVSRIWSSDVETILEVDVDRLEQWVDTHSIAGGKGGAALQGAGSAAASAA